ncbi:uncharacterized protein LOC120896718 isoform X4 [Anopheles arabiensis]|uniref:uncharacterized protein LOC120896718 isoform X4 n=1 Tax=Anopheles arabiensis TaxID=7173 RepID=UPI001AAD8F5D|nr:uncharacterized protein LOC120896718 isoform X4 [Anopheles arabiensis]
MRCSSCISGNRGSQSSSDYGSTSAVKANRTADLVHSHQNMDQQPDGEHSPEYRVDSPSSKQECLNGMSTVAGDYRHPSIIIEELEDVYDDDNDNGAVADRERNPSTIYQQYEDSHDPTGDNFIRLSTHPSRLEVIQEEETSECSDSEYSHILPANDHTVQLAPVNNLVDGAGGDENTAAHVTTKFSPANVLREFIKHHQRRKRRRDIPRQGASTRFQQKEHQVATTCMLVDTKESDMAPVEYRSICTTETVNNEMMQAEVINIGSNSSSLDDLSDLDADNREKTPAHLELKLVDTPSFEEFIDHIDADEPTDPHICKANECTQNLAISGDQCLQYDILNHSGDSATHAQASNFQPNQMREYEDAILNDSTLSGGVRDDLCELHNAERANRQVHNVAKAMSEYRNTLKSGASDTTVATENWSSLGVSSSSVVVVDRDRASAVLGNNHNAITDLKDPPFSVIDRDRASKFGIDSTVNHCVRDEETPSLIEKNMYPSEADSTVETVVKKENQTVQTPTPQPIPAPRVVAKPAIPLPPPPVHEKANVTNLGQLSADSAEINRSDTPPLAQLVPLTVEALSSNSTGSSTIGQNAQAHSSGHPSKSDHANANQTSTEDCVDAVASPERQTILKSASCDDQSVLFKLIQEQGSTASSSERHHQENAEKLCKVSPAIHAQSGCTVADLTRNQAAHGNNIDREPKIEQSDVDHGGQNSCASYEETIVRLPSNSQNTSYETVTNGSTNTTGTHIFVSQHKTVHKDQSKFPNRCAEPLEIANDSSTSPHQPKEVKVADMRTEISFLKDAELQEEFRKLEIETARFERELQQITVPSHESNPPRNAEPGRKYFVSKQRDFAIERSSVANINNTMMISTGVGTDSDNRQKDDSLNTIDQLEQHDLQRSFINNHRANNATVASGLGPIPPPPPPPNTLTEPATNSEETFTKKVKDRVRELMASQAAAEEANHVIKLRGGGFASAPSTPTASRKNIEAEFKAFREIRQREAIADRQHFESTTTPNNNVSAKQQPTHTVRNFSPSRIPLATSKISFVSRNKPNDAPGKARAGDPSNHDNESHLEDNNSTEIKVNVAALIATHQEKQHQSIGSTTAAQPLKGASTYQREHADNNSIVSAQKDEATSEPIVSVSDKCQQFEQRIRKNSIDSSVNTITQRKPYNSSASLDESQPKPESGTTLTIGPKFKAKTSSLGVWSPFNRSTEVLTKEELAERSSSKNKSNTSQQSPVWTPRSAPPSPATERREFRPIGFESPKPTRRTLTPSPADPSTVVAPPWNQPGYNPPLPISDNFKPYPIQNSASNPTLGAPVRSASASTTSQGQATQVRFPPQQKSTISHDPTINTLLKSKDGKTATIKASETSESQQKGSTTSIIRTSSSLMTNSSRQSSAGIINPTANQKPLVGQRSEQASTSLQDNNYSQDRKMQQTAHKVDGIGPITREGMPLTLRSEIDEGNRDKWYKQMYQTLHKTQDDADYVTVRYKTRRGYPYKSSGYQSEPEPNYDSDYTVKYSTLDRRRTPIGLSSTSYSKFNTLQNKPTTPQQYHQQSIKSVHSSYKNQPGKIEDYIPGRSSISEKESKEWWDEVMDIFNGQLEHQKLTTSKTYTEGNLSRALKEQGYESDSTLVFRKRDPPASAALSPVEQKQYYKNMQAGGEVPLQGFRKPAPERPKDHSEEQIESDLMVEIKESMTGSQSNGANAGKLAMSADGSTNPFRHRETIACYPITNIHRPLDMFGPFPKEYRTFVPPAPPSRKSSRSNSTLKIMSQVKTNTFNRRTMLERTTTTTSSSSGMKQPSKFRSKSAGPLFYGGATSSSSIVTSASLMKEEKNQENSTRVASKRYTAGSYRTSSSSPTGQQRKASQSPVAFGRGISKERTFAEEKKRIEEKLPKIVSVSTSILRNPELKSPNEVKKALRSSYLPIVGRVETPERSSLKRYSSYGTYRSASSIYSSNKSINRVSSPASTYKREEKNGSHHHQLKKSFNRKSSTVRTTTPSITIKTSFQKASKAFGLKAKTSSNQSLARTCSTYSIDSTNSKTRRSRISDGPSSTIPPTRNHPRSAQKIFLGNSLDRGLKTVKTKSLTPVLQETHLQSMVQRNESMRSDDFFQKLFLRGHPPQGETDGDGKPTSVLEKARMWNSLTCRSEPSLKQSNYYLSQVKPVSSSKFKTNDRSDISELSTAYQIVRQIGGDVVEQVNRFESMIKLTDNQQDDQHQFGYVRGRRMEIDYSFHERSRSEPPAEKTTTTTTSTIIQEELIGTDTPRTIVGRRCQIAQRTSRSPSCRRIQYLKGKEGQVKKIIRARSLSGTNGQRGRLDKPKDELVRSHSLNLSQDSSVSRSRFRELNTFYNSLERLGQLERETSSSSNDLRPSRRMREEEIIDYDLWKRVRVQEKAERELSQLKSKLKQDQREKDLFFLPRDPEDVRWRSDLDTGLRNREKSVEDLKCILNEQALNFEDAKLRDLETRKDHYKPLWRGSSVIDVASHLEEKYSTQGEKRDEPQSLDIISSNLLSTLSSEQMKKLKNQLSEIYSNSTPKDPATPSRVSSEMYHHQEEYIINVPERASRLESLLKVRSHSVLTQDKVNQCQLRAQSLKLEHKTGEKLASKSSPQSNQQTFQSNSLPSKTFDRVALSRSLCQELKDKILEKHHTLPSIGKKKKNARPTILASEASIFSSLENTKKRDDANTTSSTQPQQQPLIRQQTSEGANKHIEDRARKERLQSHCDTESISSETSNKTVIFRSQTLCQAAADDVPVEDIKTKIKYFENKQGEDTPTVTIYHAREDSSLSEDESGTKQQAASKKSAAKGTSGSMITLSQSFTDLKDLFGEKRSVSCSAYTANSSSQESKRTSVRKMSPKRFTFRSRSSTPDYATCIQTGEVKKIKDKFESLDVNIWRQSEDIAASSERHYQSDSELSRQPFGEYEKRDTENSSKKDQSKQTTPSTIVRHHESGDVSRITHKYEAQSERARCRKSRKDRVISPIPKNPFRKDDRFMPHINVISKTASLKQEIKPTRALHHHQHHPSAKTTSAVLQAPHETCASSRTTPTPTGSARRSASSGSEEFEKLKKSPRRYIESDVNIHYKTPIRFEYKEPIPDDELAYRQAEHMRRVYQEERRRKYIHELEDMNARRHMDNILPSQKSPIPLNRYDDFPADLSPKPLIVQQPKTIARALYNFQGQSVRELSFRKGDIIYLRRQIDKNWYEGEHNATVGLLPANYIEILTRDIVNVKQPLPKKPTREGKARAKFNFTAQTAVELSLLKGELVTLTRRVDDNWFEGKIGSKKGIFPVSYVEILTDIDGEESYDIEPIVSRPQSALGVTSQTSQALTTHFDNSHTNGRISPGIVRETKTIQKTEVLHVDTSNEPISYRALYNYKPQNTDELELLEGDVVYVLEKCDDGWYVGTSARTGCFGTFPGNYVNKM